jgi:leader peptidase (prepilin peptidase)/N-methyltransferase
MPARLPFPAGLLLAASYAWTTLAVGTGDPGRLALGLILCTVLVAVTLTDLERRIIPNAIVLAGASAGVAVAAATDPASLPERAMASFAAGGFLLAVALAHPRGMGMGDVKLAAMMGLFLGGAIAVALLTAFAAGAGVGAAMVAREGMQARKRAIPFGPFLALGGILALWVGDAVVRCYLTGLAGA